MPTNAHGPSKKARVDGRHAPFASAALAVVTSQPLLQIVNGFIPGIPGYLLDFQRRNEAKHDDKNAEAESKDEVSRRCRHTPAIELAILTNDERALTTVCELYRRDEFETHPMFRVRHPMRFAAAHDKLKMLQVLALQADKDAWLSDRRLLDSAISSLNMEVVSWVHRHLQLDPGEKSVIRSSTMDKVASSGDLVLLRWILTHYGDDVVMTANATNGAATNGHLEMVKYLHEERSEGYTTGALKGAATNGHLAVLKYLCDSSSGMFPNQYAALVGAAENGHSEVVRFLLERFPRTHIGSALSAAAGHGHLDVVQFLFQSDPNNLDRSAALSDSAIAGHESIVRFHYGSGTQDVCENPIDEMAE